MVADDTLKGRALSFAFGAGALVFILAMLATIARSDDGGVETAGEIVGALCVAIVCAVLTWAAAERAIAGHAEAVDAIAERLGRAAAGDLVSPPPAVIGGTLPRVSAALEIMFRRMRRNLDRINAMALTDLVTGLPNRVHFRDEAERLLASAGPADRAALLFIDLDRFKAVNDGLGHAVGDQLLAEVARRMRAVAATHADALAARLAGDEFTILLPRAAGAGEALRLAEAVVAAVARPMWIDGHEVAVGASIGIALRPDHGTQPATLMRAADIAMYHAKAEGRGRATLFRLALEDRCPGRRPVGLPEATSAAARGGVDFAFLRDLPGGGLAGAQALWREDGIARTILPDEALVATLAGDALAVTVALDARQAGDMALVARLCAMPATPMATLLVDEATLARADAPLAGIAALRAAGGGIGLTGFGSGGLGLGAIRALAPVALHLAPALTAGLRDAAADRALVAALVALGHALGAVVVAEDGEAELLRAAGCDLLREVAAPHDSARRITSA